MDGILETQQQSFLQVKPNFVTHMKLVWHPMLVMLLLVLGIGLIQNVVILFEDVIYVFNKPGCFINLRLYMWKFILCSRMRHCNINQIQWLKSQTHLKWTIANYSMERSIITFLHIQNAMIIGLWILGVVHVEYVHYHLVDDLRLAISLRMESSWLGNLCVQ